MVYQTQDSRIPPVRIEDEMRTSYLDYAMSVIIGRALPDVRDGLKPVHRRVLYAMFREGLLHNKKYSKCAGVVGEVLKKYHPHGDSAVYDTLVRMAQPWNLRYPLVDGQGNFGSIDGDSAAAYRYTECRMKHIAEYLLQDIDKETVDFMENFDGSTMEPLVLPTRFPTLLVNGSDGIAVGMATKIPPHNLAEVMNACIYLLEQPHLTTRDLVLGWTQEDGEVIPPVIPGPDFPTGGMVSNQEAVLQAYEHGRGIVRIRARADIEEDDSTGKSRIVIHEVPYQVNKSRLVEKIAQLVQEQKIEGVSDLRDESNREGIRVVLDLRRDAFPEVVLNQLYKHSPLQSSFGINLLAIVNKQPRLLSLKDMLGYFVSHRREVTIRRCRYELKKAEDRAHILEGLRKALDVIDAVIETIRASKTTQEAREALVARFDFSQVQAQAILDMRLQKLTGLEREQILEELGELLKTIERLRSILNNEALLRNLMKEEMREIRDAFADPRRAEITQEMDSISMEDLIAEETMVVTLTHSGYIKRNPLDEFRAQKRGGKGVQGMNTRGEDFVVQLFAASTHDYVLIFTNQGRVHWLKVYDIPQAGRTAVGRPLVNLLSLEEGEKPTAILPVRDFVSDHYVFFATRQGYVKKTDLMAYSNIRTAGLNAIKLEDDDELIGAAITDGYREIILATRSGKAIRFHEEQVRPMGRNTRGVMGIRPEEKDEVVSLVQINNPEHDLLTVTENGFGKRTPISDYRFTNRGGKGIITIKTTERNGSVAGLLEVSETDQLMFTTDSGQVIRTYANEISHIGRNTQGVRLFRIEKKERITSIARLIDQEEDAEQKPPHASTPPSARAMTLDEDESEEMDLEEEFDDTEEFPEELPPEEDENI